MLVVCLYMFDSMCAVLLLLCAFSMLPNAHATSIHALARQSWLPQYDTAEVTRIFLSWCEANGVSGAATPALFPQKTGDSLRGLITTQALKKGLRCR